jgi:hypothetical protein
LIALAGGVYAAHPPAIVAGVISAWLAVALVQAIRGFRYDKDFADGVNAKFLEERLELEQAITKQHALEVLKAASAANKKRLDRKGQHLTQVAATAGLVAMVALLAKMIGIA